jgi:AraC family transcriptional regulator, regulatory protein of adaptative response / methylated-DNA-[protein]-cysteine methyltransferase
VVFPVAEIAARPQIDGMTAAALPSPATMYRALVKKDSSYEGVFWVGVRTTGVFCRPTCTAKKPLRQNVEFFPRVTDALTSGYRPCKRCRPLLARGDTPEWVASLLGEVDANPFEKISEAELRRRGIDPERARRWFQQHHGMTFQAYQRHRRLGSALTQLRQGDSVTSTAFATGYESLSGFREAVEKLLGSTPTAARGSTVLRARQLTTPLGPMLAIASDSALHLLEFTDRRMLATQLERVRKLFGAVITPGPSKVLTRTEHELAEYFAGTRREFTIPLALKGTPFQEQVWKGLLRIPYGETRSYEALAREIRHAGAQRAVGTANGSNRIAIIIPCHRVIRSDGTLSGYGGGVWRKQRLLDLEQATGGTP